MRERKERKGKLSLSRRQTGEAPSVYGCRVCTRTMLSVFYEKNFTEEEDEEAMEKKRGKEMKTLIWRSAWNLPAIPLNRQHHEPLPWSV